MFLSKLLESLVKLEISTTDFIESARGPNNDCKVVMKKNCSLGLRLLNAELNDIAKDSDLIRVPCSYS